MKLLMKEQIIKPTIDNFLKLKPIIYEYCVNLTQVKNLTSWYRNLDDANDLYQDVYLFVHATYFNKPKEKITEGKFTQIMKNCVYWTYCKKFKNKEFKVIKNLNYYQNSDKDVFLFEKDYFEYSNYFNNVQEHPDWNYLTSTLKFSERLGLLYFLNGYTKTEVAKMFNQPYNFIPRIVNIINNKSKQDKIRIVKKSIKKVEIVDDYDFLKNKINNFELVFTNNKFIKLYSLHLQGINHRIIAKRLNKSVSQVNVEIYRINQKIKKYDIKSLSAA